MDIHSVVDMARESVMANGEHAPTLYAEGKEGDITMFYFADLPETTAEKQYALFGLGRKHGMSHPGNSVVHLYFVTEAWVSFASSREAFKYNAPSEDPNKKEMLITLHLDAETAKTTMYRAEMLRDSSGALVDVRALPDEMEGINDKLLPSFLAGVLSAKMSDRELANMLTKGE